MRHKSRKSIRIYGALKVFEATDDSKELGITKNISTTGLFLITKRHWSLGTMLRLKINYLSRKLETNACVVHLKPDGAGFEFIDASNHFLQGIRFIIDDLLSKGAWFDERRKSLRKEASGPVVWEQEGNEVEGHLEDLSQGGARIRTGSPPETNIKICLYLPGYQASTGKRVLGCQAMVIHRNESSFGVLFYRPTPEFLEAVDQILSTSGHIQSR